MKIACITITYNDDFKLNEWYQHYNEYKNDLFIHIIVDNNSTDEYFDTLTKKFTESHIIRRNSNGGCTGAYNDGIKYALSLSEVDSIMLLASDIKMGEAATTLLHQVLNSEEKLGMVSPILLNADSLVNSDFGCGISKMLIMKPYCDGIHINDIKEDINYCEAVTGGANLAKREFYEQVGIQDNKLFMYSDEVDMGIRAKKLGFKMASVKSARSWHQHINAPSSPTDRRESFTKYLAGRNKVYVAKKHYGLFRSVIVFLFMISGAVFKALKHVVMGEFSIIKDYIWMSKGACMGLLGKMQENKYSLPMKKDK